MAPSEVARKMCPCMYANTMQWHWLANNVWWPPNLFGAVMGGSRSQHELALGGECNYTCCWQLSASGDMCSGLTSLTQCSARCTCQSAGNAYWPRAERTLQLMDAAAASHPHGSQSLLLGCCCSSTSTTRSSCSCWLQLAWQQLPQGQPRPGGTLLLRALLGNGGRRHACASPPPTQTGVQRRLELLLGHQAQ
jgi:hypothetical protein